MSEATKLIDEIYDSVKSYEENYAMKPPYLALSIAHRQAVRLHHASAIGVDIWEIPKEVESFIGIKVLPLEQIIVCGEQR